MINKVILVGNVGADPEVRALESGVKVARIRLATTERYTDRQTNETKEQTEWHTITLWRNLADVADKYVRKGSQLYIEGSLRTREWTDKDNQKRYTTEIVASELKLLGRRSDGQSVAPTAQQGYAQPESTPTQFVQSAPQSYVASAPQAPQEPMAQPEMPAVPVNNDDFPF